MPCRPPPPYRPSPIPHPKVLYGFFSRYFINPKDLGDIPCCKKVTFLILIFFLSFVLYTANVKGLYSGCVKGPSKVPFIAYIS